MAMLTWVLALAMTSPPATEEAAAAHDDVSFGVGWVVSHAGPGTPPDDVATAASGASAEAPSTPPPDPPPEAASESAEHKPKAPPPKVRPFAHHSDLDQRIREARRARVITSVIAGAAMGAAAVYGLVRAAEAQREMEAVRNAPRRSQFNPRYPR